MSLEMSRLSFYQPNDIHLVWDRARPLIERALEHSFTHTLGDIATGLISGEMTLWVCGDFEAAMVTQVLQDNMAKYCLLLTLSGDGFDEYKDLLPVIEQWAKDNGCSETRLYGRPGWSRKLKDFKTGYIMMSKQL
jgi:hypothetical protein